MCVGVHSSVWLYYCLFMWLCVVSVHICDCVWLGVCIVPRADEDERRSDLISGLAEVLTVTTV